MRRFSQRNSLVTLSDINITPLLDLAFVLLIIFVIMSPSIRSQRENGMKLDLPQGGGPEEKIDARDLHVVEISQQGQYMLDRRPMGEGARGARQVVEELVAVKRLNPQMVVRIRTDKKGLVEHFIAIIDGCQKNNITRFSIGTEAISSR
jgi:biopolymer transport protein ExbD